MLYTFTIQQAAAVAEKDTIFSSKIVWAASPLVCGPHLNPTRLAASQHRPFRSSHPRPDLN